MVTKYASMLICSLAMVGCATDNRPAWLRHEPMPGTYSTPRLTAHFCIKDATEWVRITTHSTYGHGSALATEFSKTADGTRFIEVHGSANFESFTLQRYKDGKPVGATQVFLPPKVVSAAKWTDWRLPDYQSSTEMLDYRLSNRFEVVKDEMVDRKIQARFTLMSFSEYLSHISLKRLGQVPKVAGDCEISWNRL